LSGHCLQKGATQMKTPNLNQEGLQKLIDSVSASLQEVLAKEEVTTVGEALSKATPGNEPPADKTPEGSSTEGPKDKAPEASESSSPSALAEESSSSSSSSGSAPSGESSKVSSDGVPSGDVDPSDAAATPADANPGNADPAADQGGTVESLQSEYEALPVEEIKMHLLAAKAALMTHMSQGGNVGASPTDAQPALPPVASPDAASASLAGVPPVAPPDTATTPEGSPPIQKSEVEYVTQLQLKDQSKTIEALQKALADKEEMIKGFGTIAERLTQRITGQRKAVVTLAAISKPGSELAKSESAQLDLSGLSYDEIKSQLNNVTVNAKLQKSDRDAVIRFSVGTDRDPSKIAHLLAKKN
jgi:hypothetical protein